MSKVKITGVLLLVVAGFTSGCKPGGNEGQKQPAVENTDHLSSAEVATHDMQGLSVAEGRFLREPGVSFISKKKTRLTVATETGSSKQKSTKTWAYGTRYKILETDSDALTIERTPLWFAASQKNSKETQAPAAHDNFFFDSRESTTEQQDVFIKSKMNHLWVFVKELNMPLKLTLNNSGQITQMPGFEQNKKAMKYEFEKLFPVRSQHSYAQVSFESYYDKTKVLSRMQSEFETFQVSQKKMGDSWVVNAPPQMGVIESQHSYTYLADEGALAKVQFVQKLSLQPGKTDLEGDKYGKAAKKALDTFQYTRVAGGSHGILWVIKTTGWVHHGRILQDYSYESQVKTPNAEPVVYKTHYKGSTEYWPSE